jgi:hypothetical protein
MSFEHTIRMQVRCEIATLYQTFSSGYEWDETTRKVWDWFQELKRFSQNNTFSIEEFRSRCVVLKGIVSSSRSIYPAVKGAIELLRRQGIEVVTGEKREMPTASEFLSRFRKGREKATIAGETVRVRVEEESTAKIDEIFGGIDLEIRAATTRIQEKTNKMLSKVDSDYQGDREKEEKLEAEHKALLRDLDALDTEVESLERTLDQMDQGIDVLHHSIEQARIAAENAKGESGGFGGIAQVVAAAAVTFALRQVMPTPMSPGVSVPSGGGVMFEIGLSL